MTIEAKPSVERVFTAEDAMRPQLVNFNSCQRVLLEVVTLLRSPFWVVHPLKSTDVTLRRLRIINDVNGTADGFMETLIKNDVVFEGAVQIEKDEATTEVVSGATYSGNTMGNCSVAYVDGGVIIVSHQQNTGIAVFKMAME